MERRFLRKANDKVFGGVCSGLAEYINVDKSLIRIITLIAIIASGVIPGLLLYFLCVIIVPYDTQTQAGGGPYTNNYDNSRYSQENSYGPGDDYREPREPGNSRVVFGVILVAIGVFLFARMFFGWLDWRYIFAGLLVFGGLYMLLGSRKS